MKNLMRGMSCVILSLCFGASAAERIPEPQSDPARLARIHAAKMPAITQPVLFHTSESGYFATLKLAEPAPQRRRALSQAKVQLGASMRFVGQQCVQLHGGIGVTDEYAGSHYFKRLAMLELAFGDSLLHLGEVSARMHDTAGVFA